MSEEQVNEQPTVSLGVGDLAGVVRIIDACSERGAFKGPELESVGALRGKIAAFVEANSPKPEEAAEEETADE